jgi:hypothetical protein
MKNLFTWILVIFILIAIVVYLFRDKVIVSPPEIEKPFVMQPIPDIIYPCEGEKCA